MKGQECARRLGACLVAGCASITQAVYADWEVIPDISLKAEANDNPALNTVGQTDTQLIDEGNRFLADALLRIRNVQPRGELTFEPRVRGDVYVEEEAKPLESTDFYLRSNGVNRGQTVRLGYTADIASEQLVGVDFLETGPSDPTDPTIDDPSDITTTQIGISEERTRVGIAPYIDIAMNSRSSIVLDGHLVDVDYDQQIGGRTDFLERGIGGEYRRLLGDQRGTLGVRAFATGYEAAVNSNTTDTRGFELIYSRAVSELWSWSVSGGTQRSDFALTQGGRRIRGTENSPIYGFSVNKRAERSSMRAELQRDMSADSLGFVAPRDELRVSWQRMMSARVNGRMIMRVIDAEGVPTVINSDRQYGRLELGMDWQLRPTWSFIASYAYARASSEVTISDAAESNALTVGIRYHGRSTQPRIQ